MFKYKQKYHIGRFAEGNRWVFGMADCSSSPSKYYVELVCNRKETTFLPIIQRVCIAGTII